MVPAVGDGGRVGRAGRAGGDAEPALPRHGRRPRPHAEPRNARHDAPRTLPTRPRSPLQRGQLRFTENEILIFRNGQLIRIVKSQIHSLNSLQVRAKMAPFWTRPQRLGYLCLRQVRKSIGPKKLSEDRLLLETLNIPNTMLGYLQLA